MKQDIIIEQNVPLPNNRKIKQEPVQKYKWKCIGILAKLKVGESIGSGNKLEPSDVMKDFSIEEAQ